MTVKSVTSKKRSEGNNLSVKRFGYDNAGKVIKFHESFPEYSVTPLVSLTGLSQRLGVKSLYVKDESRRFGLNAFKVLGGSYAIGKYISKRLGKREVLTFGELKGPDVKREAGDITFVTATDGNHGRGVAWTAGRLGFGSVVYLPKGSSEERLENIKSLGARALITELSYDDAVRLAKNDADEKGYILLQDTSFDGYEDIPGYIMEGYTTMGYEAFRQLEGVRPTHIFLQAGVGAMAGALCAFFRDIYGSDPVISIVEPEKADCIFRTAQADDGRLHFVTTEMDSIMAGLCCGEPCSLGWDILKDHADFFFSVSDDIAEKGMRILARPVKGDEKVISGESGAVTTGLAAEIMENDDLRGIRDALGMNKDSIILCISTEGDTDRESYRRIVEDRK